MRNASDLKFLRVLVAAGIAVAGLSLAASTATAKPAYVGKWQPSAAQCRSRLASDAEQVTVLTARSLNQSENICKFRSVSGGRGVWVAKVRCLGPGEVDNTRLTIWATATRLTIGYNSSGIRENYVRCR